MRKRWVRSQIALLAALCCFESMPVLAARASPTQPAVVSAAGAHDIEEFPSPPEGMPVTLIQMVSPDTRIVERRTFSPMQPSRVEAKDADGYIYAFENFQVVLYRFTDRKGVVTVAIDVPFERSYFLGATKGGLPYDITLKYDFQTPYVVRGGLPAYCSGREKPLPDRITPVHIVRSKPNEQRWLFETASEARIVIHHHRWTGC